MFKAQFIFNNVGTIDLLMELDGKTAIYRGQNSVSDWVRLTLFLCISNATNAVIEYGAGSSRVHRWEVDGDAPNLIIKQLEYDEDTGSPEQGKTLFEVGIPLQELVAAVIKAAENIAEEFGNDNTNFNEHGFPKLALASLKVNGKEE